MMMKEKVWGDLCEVMEASRPRRQALVPAGAPVACLSPRVFARLSKGNRHACSLWPIAFFNLTSSRVGALTAAGHLHTSCTTS